MKSNQLLLLPLLLPLGVIATALIAMPTGAPLAWTTAFFVGNAILVVPFVFGRSRGLLAAAFLFLLSTGYFLTYSPSNDRNWAEAASRTAHATIDGPLVTIHDIRDFRYEDETTWEARWYDATFDIREIEESYFLLTTFGGIEGIGHVMVSFRFPEDQYLILSVEIRREEGESYDPIAGVFRRYELMYVAADERDALALRTHIHQDPTWMIPMNAGPEKTGEFFLDMVERMTKLHNEPEWYNTITSSCSSNLAKHYELINEVKLPPDYRILLPGFSGELLEELDLLPPGISATEAIELLRIDDFARTLEVDQHFSAHLRSELSRRMEDRAK